jgi:opacity protein-like surface antigen
MKIRHTALAVALATAFVAGAAVAQQPVTPPVTTEAASPMTETDVRAAMGAEGYTEINDVKFTEGVWTADAKSADGNHVEVKLDAATGKIIPDEHVAKISKDEVIVKVQAAGYTNVHDVDFEGGVWKVEANDSAGNDVELKVDPDNGRILGSEKDAIGGNKP